MEKNDQINNSIGSIYEIRRKTVCSKWFSFESASMDCFRETEILQTTVISKWLFCFVFLFLSFYFRKTSHRASESKSKEPMESAAMQKENRCRNYATASFP